MIRLRGRAETIVGVTLVALFASNCSLRELGRNIPQPRIEDDYFFAWVWAILLGLTILFWPVRLALKRNLMILWAAKTAVTLGLMLFYEWHYPLDAYFYFDTGRGSGYGIPDFALGKGTDNMIRFCWLQQTTIGESYHALKVSCAFVGLIGIYFLYRAAVLFLNREDDRLIFLFGLFPSIIFWSSILGKDPITMLGVALYCYGVMSWYRRGGTIYWAAGASGVLIAMLIRVWMGPILLAPLAVFLWARVRPGPARIAFIVFGSAFFLWGLSVVLKRFNVETSQDLFLTTNSVSHSWMEGGSGQQLDTQFTTVGTMLLFMPIGIVTALFRPFPGEVLNAFGFAASLENVFLIWLLVQAFRRTRGPELKDPRVAWAILVVLCWAAVYGFVSYQNLGSAVRFRLQVLPVMLGILMYLGRRREPVRQPAQLPRRPVGLSHRRPLRERPGA